MKKEKICLQLWATVGLFTNHYRYQNIDTNNNNDHYDHNNNGNNSNGDNYDEHYDDHHEDEKGILQ